MYPFATYLWLGDKLWLLSLYSVSFWLHFSLWNKQYHLWIALLLLCHCYANLQLTFCLNKKFSNKRCCTKPYSSADCEVCFDLQVNGDLLHHLCVILLTQLVDLSFSTSLWYKTHNLALFYPTVEYTIKNIQYTS